MNPKACVMTSVHPPFDIRIFHKECKSLAAAGYDVTLIAPFDAPAEPHHVDGVAIRAVPRSSHRFQRLTRTVWRVYREAIKQTADVYHFHDPELIPVGLLLRLRGKKVVYDIHEDLPRCMPYKPYLPKWVGRAVAGTVEMLENFASRFFSALVAATPGIAVRFSAINDRTVIVNNYPLMTELLAVPKRPWEERDVAVTYVGSSVSASRGAVEMVQAMGLLPPHFEASLALAGPFLPANLQDALATEPGWNRVRVLGMLPRPEVANVLSRARAGLVVEHPEPNYVAGKPIKMYEYMAAGIPVISSDFPLWRQIVDGAGCGLCVDSLNPHKISEAIHYLLTHPKEAEEMGQRGRQAIIERYNWDREKRKLLHLYAELMGSEERRRVPAAA
jgi:glycosyltransferase involved in cell wall biosynthesis